MNFIHYTLQLGPEEAVEVRLDREANVRLLDDKNFEKYQRGERHRYRGGRATAPTVTLAPPHPGLWHLVVDLGGYPGSVDVAIEVVREPSYA